VLNLPRAIASYCREVLKCSHRCDNTSTISCEHLHKITSFQPSGELRMLHGPALSCWVLSRYGNS
jgi:hypothetical protein